MAGQATLPRSPDKLRNLIVRMKILAALTARRSSRRIRDAYAASEALRLAHDPYCVEGPRAAVTRDGGLKTERRILLLLLASAGCLFVVGALTLNVGTTLLSIFACLACGTRIEGNYRRGEYRRVPPENVE